MRQRSIKKYLIGFRKHLQEDSGNADLTLKTHLIGAKSFYHKFYIEIPILPMQEPHNAIWEQYRYTHMEYLQEILKVSDPLEKAVLHVGVTSGLSTNEIWSDFFRKTMAEVNIEKRMLFQKIKTNIE